MVFPSTFRVYTAPTAPPSEVEIPLSPKYSCRHFCSPQTQIGGIPDVPLLVYCVVVLTVLYTLHSLVSWCQGDRTRGAEFPSLATKFPW